MNILLILFVVVIIIAIIITFMNFKSGGAKSDDLSLLCTAFNYQIVEQTIKHRDFIEGSDVRQLDTTYFQDGKIQDYCFMLKNLEIMQYLSKYFTAKYAPNNPTITYEVKDLRHQYRFRISNGKEYLELQYTIETSIFRFVNTTYVLDNIVKKRQYTFNSFADYYDF
jgi:hypothetical protein